MRFVARTASLWLVLLLAVGACAQDDRLRNERAIEAAMEADRQLAACLEDAGHSAPLENADIRRLEDPQFNGDVEACAAQLDIAVPPAGDATRELAEVALRVVECLRAQGWDVPEPVSGPHGALSTGDLAAAIPADQRNAFQSDYDDCFQRIPPVVSD